MTHVIYKIVCDDVPDYVYVGSTKAFRQRKAQHKSDCININKRTYNMKVYSTIRENGGWDNWRMVIINECEEGITKTQAHIIEEEFRVKLNGNLNSHKCYITEEKIKEEKKKYDKKYHENNKEYYEENKEKRKKYYEENKQKLKEYKKEYYEENKEKIKEYREQNKEKIKEYYENNKEKITCECGCKICKLNLTKHQKTKKHIKLMEKQNETK